MNIVEATDFFRKRGLKERIQHFTRSEPICGVFDVHEDETPQKIIEAIETITDRNIGDCHDFLIVEDKTRRFMIIPPNLPAFPLEGVVDAEASDVKQAHEAMAILRTHFKNTKIKSDTIGISATSAQSRLVLTDTFIEELKENSQRIKVEQNPYGNLQLLFRSPEFKIGNPKARDKVDFYSDSLAALSKEIPGLVPTIKSNRDAQTGVFYITTDTKMRLAKDADPIGIIATKLADAGVNFPGSDGYISKSPG